MSADAEVARAAEWMRKIEKVRGDLVEALIDEACAQSLEKPGPGHVVRVERNARAAHWFALNADREVVAGGHLAQEYAGAIDWGGWPDWIELDCAEVASRAARHQPGRVAFTNQHIARLHYLGAHPGLDVVASAHFAAGRLTAFIGQDGELLDLGGFDPRIVKNFGMILGPTGQAPRHCAMDMADATIHPLPLDIKESAA